MASVKVIFQPSQNKGGFGCICYRITHDRKVRQFSTPYLLREHEWDSKHACVLIPDSSPRRLAVKEIHAAISDDLARLSIIQEKLTLSGSRFSADDIISKFNLYLADYSFFNHLRGLIDRLAVNGNERTAETYDSALRSFSKFRAGKDVLLHRIDSALMEAYQAWLRRRGLTPNSISFYMRILRAAYNRAVSNGLIDDRRPFRHVYTGVEKTVKRAVPLSVVRQISKLSFPKRPAMEFAKDMFLLSFFLRGMSLVDMVHLKKSDLRNGVLSYRRRKTGQRLKIGWTEEMSDILAKYPDYATGYLLPIVKSRTENVHKTHHNITARINRQLRELGRQLHLGHPLTMYVARHSWASAAKAQGIPLSIIAEGMGHDSEATTRIYLASLETSVVDDANALILKALK